MNDTEAAWVRKYVWTLVMRKTYASVPAVLTVWPLLGRPARKLPIRRSQQCSMGSRPCQRSRRLDRHRRRAGSHPRWHRELAGLGGRYQA